MFWFSARRATWTTTSCCSSWLAESVYRTRWLTRPTRRGCRTRAGTRSVACPHCPASRDSRTFTTCLSSTVVGILAFRYSAPDREAEYCDERVCLCVFVCPRSYLQNCTPIFTTFFLLVSDGRGSVLLWRRSDTLLISGFMDDVIFAHKLIGCSTSPPGWGSEAHMYAVLGLARRNTRCRQWTLRTTSCSQGLLGRSGRVVYLWHDICT